MNAIKKIFGGDTRQLGMIFALIALIVFFQIKTGLTLDPNNVNNKTPLSSYVDPATGMVLARVIFANGNASWVNGPTQWPPVQTVPTPWTIKIHAAGIDCK